MRIKPKAWTAVFLVMLLLGLPIYTAEVFALPENNVRLKVKDNESTVYLRWGRVSPINNQKAVVKHSSIKTPLFAAADIPTVDNFTAVDIGEDYVNLSWNETSFADFQYYALYRDSSGITNISDISITSHRDTGLNASTTYVYEISIIDTNDDEGEKSNLTVTTNASPATGDGPELNVTLPEYINELEYYVKGTVTPESKVKVYINGVYERLIKREDTEEGVLEFTLTGLQVGENAVRITAEGLDDNISEISDTIIVDIEPPEYEISDIPSIALGQPLLINGSVTEYVTIIISYYLKSSFDFEAPAKVTGLSEMSVSNNSIQIEWDESQEDDFLEHSIYRDDKRLTSIYGNQFYDLLVKSDKEYAYQVSAFDETCNEGEKSDELTVKTDPFGDKEINDSFDEEEKPCNETPIPSIIQNTTGLFNASVTLQAGVNVIIINITDRAGNTVTIEKEVLFDETPPVITDNNLDRLSPSYTSEVTIKGSVDEPSTVVVFVNNESSFNPEWWEWPTNIGPDLFEKFGRLASGDTNYIARTDSNGNFSISVSLKRENVVEYEGAPYGSSANFSTGEAWANHIKIVATDEAGMASIPVEGIINYTTCGFGFDWHFDRTGVYPDTIIPRFIIEGLAQLSFTVNLEWQGLPDSSPQVTGINLDKMYMSDDQKELYDEEWLSNIETVLSDDKTAAYFLIDIKSPEDIPGNTTLEKEQWLSEHNAGECTTDIANVSYGCIKFPLMLEVVYDYTDPYTQDRTSGKVQKQCWTGEVMIDRRVPPSDFLPEAFLNSTISLIDSILGMIDPVLEFVDTAKKWLSYGCLGSWVIYWVKRGREFFSCVGLDPKTCDPDQPAGEGEADCRTCLEARQSTIEFWELSQWICDRVTCPAAPTVQRYIKDAQGKDVASHCKGKDLGDIKYDRERNDEVDKEYRDIKNLDLEVRDKANNDYGKPNEKYCEAEYIREWDSTAILMNELKESECLSEAGKNESHCTGLGAIPRLLSGLCTGQGAPERTVSLVDGVYYIIGPWKNGTTGVWHGTSNEQYTCKPTDTKKDIYEDCEVGENYSKFISRNETEPYFKTKDCYGNNKLLRPHKDSLHKENISESVYNMVCVETKDVVIDPTADLVQAVRAVCLSAISGYLTTYKSILDIVKTCFQTILETGDGSSGMCQEILSVYVCDLIYFAIRCIVQSAGSQFSGGITKEGDVVEGIGNFLSYISDAGSATEDKVLDRYGGTNMFKTFFVERKLVHALCLFAFTGDFELEPLIEASTTTDVPIATTCVLDVKRRFMRYDPSSFGMATFLYHTGIMMVSGADDLTYKLFLQCSNDNQCNPDEFKNGYCDCSHPYQTGAERTEMITSGELTKGQTVNEEILDSSVLLPRPFRFDRAFIEISYTNNMGERVTEDCAEVDIRMEGGKPPVECEFDVGGLEYRCTFIFGTRGAIYFIEYPTLVERYPHFGDMIRLKGKVEKRSASSEETELMHVRTKLHAKDNPLRPLHEKYWPIPSDGVINLRDLNDGNGIPNIKVDSSLFSTKATVSSNKGGNTSLIDLTPSVVRGDLGVKVMIKFNDNDNISNYEIIEPKNGTSKKSTSNDTLILEVKTNYKEAKIIIRGKPQAGEIVTITPPASEERALVLEVGLHQENEERKIDTTPVETKTIEFTVFNERLEAVGRCSKDGTEAEPELPCDCNIDGIKDSNPPLDCKGNSKYCYELKSGLDRCYEKPKCKTDVENTEPCDCDLDGKADGDADCDGDKTLCINKKCEEPAP